MIPKPHLALLASLLVAFGVSYFSDAIDPYHLDVLTGIGINVILAVSLNLVNGYTGQFSLGHAGFMAVGAYLAAAVSIFAGPHLLGDEGGTAFQQGLLFLGALLAGGLSAAFAGLLVGVPSLRLRGDYLALVTLGFGEIIRVFLNNLDAPVNITNGPKGLTGVDPVTFFGLDLSRSTELFGIAVSSVTLYYYLFMAMVIVSVVVCYRLERSRIGRAWMAIREDEIAARAMGINTRNMKLLAFGMGATFGGVAGTMFASFQRFISPESFALQESIMIVAMVVLGGIGHIPGVILGALLLAALPEVLRYVADPLQAMTGGRLDASILRQLLVALAMISIMLARPRGLWPSPEHGKAAPEPVGK
jgi:branched-chain amino acid transport system permease protein